MERNLKELVSQMTLEEKAGMCSGADFWHLKGVDRLGIPSVMVCDGPHGLRKQDQKADHLGINDSIVAVCFPAACATASSWDVDLLEGLGRALGNECQAEDVSVILGPGANIKRSPLCGRNFEYYSEDPYLAGKLAAAQIRGVQSQGVGTSLKHFAANNQEFNRMSVSAEASERTLREIYLRPFQIAVEESQPRTVMCSYNKINGVYSSENGWLLNDVLRSDWGFKGFVVTDWGAVADRVKGIKAGLDLEMPASGGINDAKIVAAVQAGELDEATLDQAVERILEVVYAFVDEHREDAVFDRDADHELAASMAAECAVLLQNDGTLPLAPGAKVAYIGGFAEAPRFQGGGSSHINCSKVTSALEIAGEKGRGVTYVRGYAATEGGAELDPAELAAAVEAARAADVAVIFAGLPDVIESEGYDRKDLELPACQNALIEAVLDVQPHTVVVLHNGAPVVLPWADRAAAILEMYLGGQGEGEACDRLLFGEANPSGRLAETFPLRLEDTPSYLNFPGDGRTVDYAEGVYVGYRYYDAKRMPVRWAFGHGLSYTTFKYSDLQLSSDSLADGGSIEVSVDVTNAGEVAGKEVVQLYVGDRTGTFGRPVKELKGFAKIALEPGETKTATFSLIPADLAYWREDMHDWYAPSGTYEILVGHASDDIRLAAGLGFSTAKLPPFKIDGATTFGELLADPRTAPVTKAMMAQMAGAGGADAAADTGQDDDLGTGGAMREAMMYAMTIKSLVSFAAGAVDGDQLIAIFQAAVDAAQA